MIFWRKERQSTNKSPLLEFIKSFSSSIIIYETLSRSLLDFGFATNKASDSGVVSVMWGGSGTLNKDTAVDALTKIVQTQQVWQGDANAALEDNNPNNNWLDYSSTIPGNVTFDPVDDLPILTGSFII